MNRWAPCLVMTMLLATSAAVAQTSGIQLSISQPKNGDVVPRRLDVTGTSAGLGANTIALFVYSPPAGRWFFQGEATVGPDGRWEVGGVVVSGGVGVRPGDDDFHFVATAMSELPPGLSDVPDGEFPLPGTLALSPVVLVKRGN